MPATGPAPPTSGWMSRSIPRRQPARPTGSGRTTRPLPSTVSIDTGQQTSGDRIQAVAAVHPEQHLVLQPARVSALPSRCAIWNVTTQAVVPGTDNTSPSWSGTAGSGWVACAYSGVTLPAGDYKVSVYYGGGQRFYTEERRLFRHRAGGQRDHRRAAEFAERRKWRPGRIEQPGHPRTRERHLSGWAFAYPDTSSTPRTTARTAGSTSRSRRAGPQHRPRPRIPAPSWRSSRKRRRLEPVRQHSQADNARPALDSARVGRHGGFR